MPYSWRRNNGADMTNELAARTLERSRSPIIAFASWLVSQEGTASTRLNEKSTSNCRVLSFVEVQMG